jgi:hypothetical protein
MANTFLAVAHFAGRRPGLYLGLCCTFGVAVRLWMAHGDIGLFFNPLFPFFIR